MIKKSLGLMSGERVSVAASVNWKLLGRATF